MATVPPSPPRRHVYGAGVGRGRRHGESAVAEWRQAMKPPEAQGDRITAAECLAALKLFRADERCRRCTCLDWALAELQEAVGQGVADEAALLRVAPERLHPPPCREGCLPLDAVITWLLSSGRHTADL